MLEKTQLPINGMYYPQPCITYLYVVSICVTLSYLSFKDYFVGRQVLISHVNPTG